MNVPFLDLNAQHAPLRQEFHAAIEGVIDRCVFAGGPVVEEFEEEFAVFCRCRHAIGVGSGTEALWLSLLALGIGPGDEVITVPNSFMATAEAITYCGARPVFVDVDEHTYTMDPKALAKAVTSNTKAVIPVHLFGQMADMKPIQAVANEFGLKIIEDACQAHGAEYTGQRAGSIGDTGCFSFYPGKNLGAFGEAGAVVTNNSELYDKIRILRDHGQDRRYYHSQVGWNCRMDGIQAAVLRIKLPNLETGNQLRRAHAAHYNQALCDIREITIPTTAFYAEHVFHIYAIRVRERDRIMRHLASRGIGCAVHYPVTIHLQEAYRSLGYAAGAFHVAERCAAEFISLPMYPELKPEQVEQVTEVLREAVTCSI
ncbi:MAG: DegT/DnrJ/EryC1/StrS family aminotransferase [Verrucomicrobia bacterium]|nr:DegT/DnrJ/EryC1/StrS family aminotransferase [Verrucomicrobiota bacterium]